MIQQFHDSMILTTKVRIILQRNFFSHFFVPIKKRLSHFYDSLFPIEYQMKNVTSF